MSLHNLAQQLAARGRSGDSVLVHMTPGEVGGLQAIAMAHGGSLTTNPDTGLPEANFLKAILPMLAGAVLTGGLGVPAFAAAALVGGGTAMATKNLGQGLMAGLGAFGGAGLGGALAGLGSSAAGAGAELAGSAISAPGAGIAATGPGSQAAMLAAQNEGFGQAGLQSLAQAAGGTAPSAGATMGAGLTAAMRNPQALISQLGGNEAALQTAGMAAAPALMGMGMGQGEMQGDSEENPHPMLAPASYGYAPRSRASDVPSSRLQFAQGGIASLESNPYYTMSGDSADAFKYLMGQRSTGRSAQEIEAAAIPRPTTVTGPQYQGLPQFTLDTMTRRFTPTGSQESAAQDAPAPRAGDRMFSLQELDTGGVGGEGEGFAGGDEGFAGEGEGFAGGGRLLAGPGDGVSDSISATIDDRVPAKLATGEFVFDARTVSEIGNGDTKAGAKKLFAVMNAIHKKRASAQRGKPSGADRELVRLA